MRSLRPLTILLPACVLASGACEGGQTRGDSARSAPVDTIVGAGATFPYPLYARWFGRYAAQSHVVVNYQSVGSAAGVRMLAAGTVDFAATDNPLPQPALESSDSSGVAYVPMVVGAVAVAYHVTELASARPLRLDAPTLAAIYTGRVARWNDRGIAALNPGIALPRRPIIVVYRGDSSGTGYAFSSYLARGDAAWRASPGAGERVAWPTGRPARGNEGVAAELQQTADAIGFVELTYATQSHLRTSALRNAAGAFVSPSIGSARAAAAAAADTLGTRSDFRISLVDAPGAEAYPIAAFSYVLVPRRPRNAARAGQLLALLRWAIRDGTDDALALGYAPLPERLVPRVEAQLDTLAGGSSLR